MPGVEAYYEIRIEADPRLPYGEVPILLAPTAAEAKLMVPGSLWVVLDRRNEVRARGRAGRVKGLQPGIVLEKPLRVYRTEIFAVQRIGVPAVAVN